MTKKTPEQTIAALEAKLARAKEAARKVRTRRLIQVGAFFEPYLTEWEALTDDERRAYAGRLGKALRDKAQGGANAQP